MLLFAGLINKNHARISVFFCREVRTERMTYHAMMAAKQLNPRKIIMGIQVKIKINLIFIVLPGKVLEFEGEHGNLCYQKETG